MIDNIIFKSATEALVLVKEWKNQKLKIVFTNGCFDLIHPGHVRYLEEAKALGDRLIIGLNSDQSVKKLKGETRPLQNEWARASVIAAFKPVDAVFIFNEDTPYESIKLIQPSVLVKGGDWKEESIVGSDIVKANGGIVKSLKFIDGYSTSEIVDRIKSFDK